LVGADPMGQIDPDDCRLWAKQLCKGRTRHCVITSLPGGDPQYSLVGHYDRERDSYTEYRCAYIPSAFPGTGDCFAAFCWRV
ncbi:MAG: hypothetical protein U1B83_05990, partial [Candidatus Cloacimonadaceae bacterium]|nr:hypothetical protein [Candidatus Cloacimonadaceae bacterium]